MLNQSNEVQDVLGRSNLRFEDDDEFDLEAGKPG